MAVCRWAVLGTGSMAAMFVRGLRASHTSRVTVVGSRHADRARAFVASQGLGCPGVSIQEAMRAPDVDAVYVATPPSTHVELALASLQAGRATLVEKPLATTGDEARRLAVAAHDLDVFCMEALWTRFLPLSRAVERMLADRVIGDVHTVVGSFGTPSTPDSPHLFDPRLGGGALLDRAVYPLSFAVAALGRPEVVRGATVSGASGVDVEAAAVLGFGGDRQAVVQASFRSGLANDLRYVGDRGTIVVDAPIYRPVRAHLWQHDGAGSVLAPRSEWLDSGLSHGVRQAVAAVLPASVLSRGRPLWRPYRGSGYHYQADEVAACLAAGLRESPRLPLADSVAVLDIVDRIRQEAS